MPDGFCHWRFDGHEGAFALEWDRGTESLATLARKIESYGVWWRRRRYRELLPGTALKPRLAIITTEARARRLATFASRRKDALAGTVAIAPDSVALSHPLDAVWWRSDTRRLGSLF